MAPPDLSRRIDDQHESLWDNLLLAGRLAWFSRSCRSDESLHSYADYAAGKYENRIRGTCRSLVALLAFCGRGMDCRFHSGLRDWTVREEYNMGSQILKLSGQEQMRRMIVLPAPSAWPIVMAFG